MVLPQTVGRCSRRVPEELFAPAVVMVNTIMNNSIEQYIMIRSNSIEDEIMINTIMSNSIEQYIMIMSNSTEQYMT